MKIVYIVTSGSYSDYHIDAAFTTMDLAARYVDVHNHGQLDGDYEIEELELDTWDQTEISREMFSVALVAETGAEFTDEDYKGDPMYPRTEKVVAQQNLRTPNYPALIQQGYRLGVTELRDVEKIVPTYVIGRSFISHDHARKVAADYRTRMLLERSDGMRDGNFKWIAQTEEPQFAEEA